MGVLEMGTERKAFIVLGALCMHVCECECVRARANAYNLCRPL